MTANPVPQPQRRHRSVVVAMTLAVAIVAGALGLASPASAAPGTASIAVTPGTVDSGDTVTVTVGLPGSCGAFMPAEVPVRLRPTGAAVDAGWSGTVDVDYDVSVHAYQGSTTVTVDDLLAENSTRGSWTATALLDEILCGDELDPVSTTFTIQPLATTTTTSAAPPTTWPTTTTTWSTSGSFEDVSGFTIVIGSNEYGQLVLRNRSVCTSTYTYTATSGTSSSTTCVITNQLVFIAGQNGAFAPGTEITLWIFSDPVKVGTTTANAQGGFGEMAITIPDIPLGRHELRAVGTGTNGQPVTYVIPIEVKAGTPGELAFTGASDQTPWFALGAVLAILVGMVLIGMTLRPEPVLVEMRSLRPIHPVDPRRRRTRTPD